MKIFLLLTLLLAAPLAAADFSGTWTLDGDVAGNPVKGSCVLKQDGAKITGVCKLEGKDDAPAKGEASAEKVVFQHDVEHNGTTYTLEYVGKKVSDTELKGDINVRSESVTGYFTAKKN
jgi:hypothetical protein